MDSSPCLFCERECVELTSLREEFPEMFYPNPPFFPMRSFREASQLPRWAEFRDRVRQAGRDNPGLVAGFHHYHIACDVDLICLDCDAERFE